MTDNRQQPPKQTIIPVDVEEEMKKSFIEYAMSVIIDRALPDVRDGLKPVHRRILFSMYINGFTPDKAYRKSATTVGDVLGKFHPHGEAAVYDSLVRMAQDWSLRYTLIDGHGNFGSIDGDAPAAMRYTEAKLSRIAMELLNDINKDTVDFKPNFDEHEMEPTVLPSRFPNLLVNGSSGIAVGMATNMPPHNLNEVVDGIIKVIDNPDVSTDELNRIIKGPDFPTGALIIGKQGIKDAYRTGRGRITVRAVASIEQLSGGRQRIVVTEIPYQVNKAALIEKIAELVKDKKIDGISNINDESGRNEPVRIVIDLKREANANVVLNQLYKHTQMQSSFNVNMVAIVPTENKTYEPKVINLRQAIDYYIDHQKDVIKRRTKFDLDKAEARAHILEGYKIAVDHIDEVVEIIKNSRNEDMAKKGLMDKFNLSEKQAQAIVDMRLGRLTALGREEIEKELKDIVEKIKYYREILANESMVLDIIKKELTVLKEKYGDKRRTKIVQDVDEIDIEDLIQEEDVVITLTHFGYVKRIPADTYKSQRRGGKGIIGISTRQEDFVESIFVCTTHHFLLFFTSKGRVYRLKAYEIPESSRQGKGMAIVNLLQINPDEKITAVIPIAEYREGLHLVMATKNGIVKKTNLMEYENVRKGGIMGVLLRENDELIDVKLTAGGEDLVLVTGEGMAIRFSESQIRPMGRAASGVIGIRLDEGDRVVGMEVCGKAENSYLLTVTENGFGKRTELSEYRAQLRGGKGILTYRVTERTGKIAGMELVKDEDDVMIINSDGSIIRLRVSEISILGRATRGVTLMRLNEGVSVVSMAKVAGDEDDE